MTGEWSGNVDLNDGKLQQLYTEFKATLGWIDKIGLDTSDISLIRKDLENALARISLEINFISNGMYLILLYLRMYIVRSLELQTTNSAYKEKLKSSISNDQMMFSLSWDIEELKNIGRESRKLYSDLRECVNTCTHELFHESNVPRKLAQIRQRMCEVMKRIVHFKREPATHIFILMISSDARDKKPYALPVQWLPYAGIKEVNLRRIVSELCKKMVSLGMKVSGTLPYYMHTPVPYNYLCDLIVQDSVVMES